MQAENHMAAGMGLWLAQALWACIMCYIQADTGLHAFLCKRTRLSPVFTHT